MSLFVLLLAISLARYLKEGLTLCEAFYGKDSRSLSYIPSQGCPPDPSDPDMVPSFSLLSVLHPGFYEPPDVQLDHLFCHGHCGHLLSSN